MYHWARRKKRVVTRAVTDAYCHEHPGIYLNWNLPPRRWDNMTKMHWCVTRVIWQERKLYAVLSACLWPLKAVVLSARMTRQHGLLLRRKIGISLSRQFLAQVYLAMRYFIAPRAYYFYGLYDDGNRSRVPLFVQDHEVFPLDRLTHRGADRMALEDKRRFSAACKRFRLPAVPVVAEFEDGELKQWGEGMGNQLPKADLFAKPALGRCANGAMLYTYEPQGVYRCHDGTLKTAEELMDSLCQASRAEPYVLQERYSNHPDIAALSPGALCTFRVVTCRLPDGRCEDIITIFKMPTRNRLADNFAVGGLAVAVDKKGGLLGSAITKDLDAERTDIHPVTGQKIAGFRIPHWDQVIPLCLRAHAAFSDYAHVGWDVAVTRDGPVLIEGNLGWGVEGLQRGHGGPLGETRFAESYMAHVKHRGCFRSLLRPDFWTPEDDKMRRLLGEN
jgi:hypothetical protein